MLKVENLRKQYRSFLLDGITFTLPEGYILGFIGQNGAGKSTTIKCLTGVNPYDEGTLTVFGKDFRDHSLEILQDVGFSSGAMDCYPNEKVEKIGRAYGMFFKNYDNEKFLRLCKTFHIDPSKKVRELSQGMKVKLGIALALSHDAKLIILDEPTSGLDPVAREELLDLLQKIMEQGNRSILFSTHVTSDLDKCADYILFINDGKQILFDTKDNIIEGHALVRGKKEALTGSLKERLVGHKVTPIGFTGLMKRKDLRDNDDVETSVPTLEDIMVYYVKEEIVL